MLPGVNAKPNGKCGKNAARKHVFGAGLSTLSFTLPSSQITGTLVGLGKCKRNVVLPEHARLTRR